MNSENSPIYENKKMSSKDIKKEGERALKEIQSQNKKDGKDRKKSDYTKYLESQLAFKKKKYEEQKKRQLEKIKEREGKQHLERAKASISGIKTQSSSSSEKDPTVAKKTLENIGSVASGLGGAAYHGVRYLLAKRNAAKKAKQAKEKQQEKKEMGSPGRPKKTEEPVSKKSAFTIGTAKPQLSGAPERKLLSPERKKSIPSTKRLPPSGGVPEGSRGPKAGTLGQRARQNPKIKADLIKQRMSEEYSNWREELFFEQNLIIEVEDTKKTKKEKIVNIMKGKNKITINPDISEENVKEFAMLVPMAARIAGGVAGRAVGGRVATAVAGNATSGSLRSISAELLGKKAGEMTADAVKKKIEKKFKDEDKMVDESAAWTRKEGKNKKGGLNEKGRKSYENDNPGSDLKAPSKKVGNPRRASFCARMKGMKEKLTSKKTANDRNSRINKSLRAWNC